MHRPPIPSDHETLPRNAAEIMLALRDQIGLPLAAIIDLDLQTIHDLFSAHTAPEDAEDAERLVVVDDETLPVLDEAITAAIAQARPDRRIREEGYEGWISRSRAIGKVGGGAAQAPLPEVDALVAAADDGDTVVLEDEDYRRVMAALNQAVSSRSHGRSRAVGGGLGRTAALAAARGAVALLLPHDADDVDDRGPIESTTLADADTGGALFRHNFATNSLRLVAPDGENGENEVVVLQAIDRDHLLAAAIWLGERRHLWAGWQLIAEESGGDELRDHVSTLHGGSPVETILCTIVANGAEDDPQVKLIAVLPSRTLVVLEHRFSSNAHREAFVRWVEQGEPYSTLEAFSLLALLEGPRALAAHIEAASTPIPPTTAGGSAGMH